MKCELCEIIELERNILYMNEEVVVAVKDTAIIPGQVTVFPKEHFTILEMVPKDLIQKCSIIANKVGVAVFESLESQGTNIFIKNGLSAGQKAPHFSIEIIPRRENDGLNLQWESKQLMEDEMELATSLLTDEIKKVMDEDLKKKRSKVSSKVEIVDDKQENMENYLLKSLKKIP
jgi:diadenosine tetraphosphate (Ap4A) HIT family hydrolase